MKFFLLLLLCTTSSVLAETSTLTNESSTVDRQVTDKEASPTTPPDAPSTAESTGTPAKPPQDDTTTAKPEETTTAKPVETTTIAGATTEKAEGTTTEKAEGTTTAKPEVTTTAIVEPTTVPTPGPRPSYEAPGDWDVKDSKNVTCLKVHMSMQLSVIYNQTDNKTQTTYIDVPTNATKTENSQCGNFSDVLALKWKDYTLELEFTDANGTAKKFGLTKVTFTYTINTHDFPGARDVGTYEVENQTPLTSKLAGDLGKSYKCDADDKLALNDNIEFYYKNVQVQAFMSSDSFGTVEECPADDKTDDIVPIAVGCALAGLVIIVLIAYMVGRRRSRQKGYQSV